MLEILAILFSLANAPHFAMSALPAVPKPSFKPADRAVDNWRRQAALDLDVGADTALRWLASNSPANLPRCIRLNNYWCIKKAGWAGELAADPEGHVAFASAQEGAVVAAQLLRRYYLDYGRKSARAIVTHWAPAQCEAPAIASSGQGAVAQPARTLGPLAKFGIGKTLRARWLAAHGRGGTIKTRRSASKLAVKRSVVPDPLVAGKPAPRIALVNGEPEPPLVLEPLIKTERLRVASMSPPRPTRDAPLLPTSPAQTQPVASCAGETLRLENYAVRAIQGIARSPDEDLRLFATDGSPWPALPRLLANMAAVEIGPYRADVKLIDAAVEAVRSARGADAARD
jgi:hypothetical protein